MAFDAQSHLVKLKGNALYLPVTWRLVWLREEHPDAVITTELVTMDLDRGLYVFRATVTVPSGASATGYGSETQDDFPAAPLEKAETKALGRALAALGLGTQFALEIEEVEGVRGAEAASTRTSAARSPAQTSTRGSNGASEAAKAKEPTVSPEEQEARGLVRGRLAAAFPDMEVGTWRELVNFAHEKYGLEIPTPEQDRDPAFRLGYMHVFANRLPASAQEPDEEALLTSYRARLEEAESVAAVSAIMHEAKDGGTLGAAILKDLAQVASERVALLRSTAV